MGPSILGLSIISAHLTLTNHKWALLTLANLNWAFDTWAFLFWDQISFWPISLGPQDKNPRALYYFDDLLDIDVSKSLITYTYILR